jgi:RNA polymerase sigma-70 factor (ECF subfamily)
MTAASAHTTDSVASDADLVGQVLAGDRGTFSMLVRRHNQRLFRACRAVLHDDEDAQDAAQAAWVSAYRHLATFRGEAAFATWVTRIAVHEASARLRRRERPALVALEEVTVPDDRDPERAASTGELGELLERHVDALPDGLRSVLVLRDVLELDTAETATCLGITEEAVRVRLHRARHALARELVGVVEAALPDVWRFDGQRCARMVDAVMAQITKL